MRHEPHRRLLQRRRRHGLLQADAPRPLGRPRQEAGARPAGHGPRHPPGCRREAPPDLRARPLDAQPLHPRRDDRQQLVRRPLAHGPGDRTDLRPGRRARHPALRRHPDDRRRHRRGRARADHPGRGPQGRDLRPAQGAPRPLRRPDPATLPEGRPPPRLGLQPRRPAARERVPRRPRPGRHRGDLRHHPRGAAAPRPQPVRIVGPRARLPRRLQRRRPHHRGHAVRADRPGGARRLPRRGHEEEGHPPAGDHAPARGGRLAPGRVRRRDQGGVGRQGAAADGPSEAVGATRRR